MDLVPASGGQINQNDKQLYPHLPSSLIPRDWGRGGWLALPAMAAVLWGGVDNKFTLVPGVQPLCVPGAAVSGPQEMCYALSFQVLQDRTSALRPCVPENPERGRAVD